jgi:hypothetical protein
MDKRKSDLMMLTVSVIGGFLLSFLSAFIGSLGSCYGSLIVTDCAWVGGWPFHFINYRVYSTYTIIGSFLHTNPFSLMSGSISQDGWSFRFYLADSLIWIIPVFVIYFAILRFSKFRKK